MKKCTKNDILKPKSDTGLRFGRTKRTVKCTCCSEPIPAKTGVTWGIIIFSQLRREQVWNCADCTVAIYAK